MDLLPKAYRYTHGVRNTPAKNSRNPATWIGVKTSNPRFIKMNELPQMEPSRMIKNKGSQVNFTYTKVGYA